MKTLLMICSFSILSVPSLASAEHLPTSYEVAEADCSSSYEAAPVAYVEARPGRDHNGRWTQRSRRTRRSDQADWQPGYYRHGEWQPGYWRVRAAPPVYVEEVGEVELSHRRVERAHRRIQRRIERQIRRQQRMARKHHRQAMRQRRYSQDW